MAESPKDPKPAATPPPAKPGATTLIADAQAGFPEKPAASVRHKKQSNDGRYYPNKFLQHPRMLPDLFASLRNGDAIYFSHNGSNTSQFFIISVEDAERGMVPGSVKFPEPANLLEVVEVEAPPMPPV